MPIGQKQSTGTEIDKAGLTNGDLYGIKVTGIVDEINGSPANGTFTLQEMGAGGDVSDLTGAQLETESDAEGVTGFLRPEGAAWDPDNPNTLYFVTTNSFTGNSRLYRATFTDITNPALGGTIEAVLDGSEGQRMFDNITVADGKVILQEDPGNQSYLARVRARAVTAGGESGDPSSPHFNDQAARYAAGDLRPVYFYPDELKGHIERRYRPGE